MKIAVCISGACASKRDDGCLVSNNKLIKSKFPTADFYYATWDRFKPTFEENFPDEKCLYFPEPKMHYHPYMGIAKEDYISDFFEGHVKWANKGGKKRLEWTSHHTKQILIHSWLVNTIQDNYDIIIRARFDTYIHENANFEPYIQDSYKHHRANCFGATNWKLLHQLREFDTSPKTRHHVWMIDQLIIHPADIIDVNTVNKLHAEKRLHAAEYGWYQVISMPYGSTHRNHSGWVNPDWSILPEFYKR